MPITTWSSQLPTVGHDDLHGVDPGHAHDLAVTDVLHRPRRRVERAVHDADLVGGVRAPDDLDAVLVLVAPHERHGAERLHVTEDRGGDVLALLDRVGPV